MATIKETPLSTVSGWLVLPVWLAMLPAGLWLVISAAMHSGAGSVPVSRIVLGVACFLLFLFLPIGLFVVAPNDSRAILFFGVYRGTVKTIGFHYVNPFSTKRRVSLRVRTFETGSSKSAGYRTKGSPIKVNDLDGSPIEIAAVVVWKVTDTAQALFTVDDYESFVEVQSESALRNLASRYHYDSPEGQGVPSLRGNTDHIGEQLQAELHQRLAAAGVEVLEARISSLAYAPEIAAAMLRRQQASAVIAARQKIVEGAVGMVDMALRGLKDRGVADLDPAQRAAIIGNLLVVLCSDQSAQPVVQTGS
ncbi:MAG: SPFH domain-containing protein [Planctomycetota bacterium]|nr:SPFH domain-containing protein [Planctomycetota bacterium]MDA1106381.1 SPFH domain-containing protein [Planctomycetota bacterium]